MLILGIGGEGFEFSTNTGVSATPMLTVEGTRAENTGSEMTYMINQFKLLCLFRFQFLIHQ